MDIMLMGSPTHLIGWAVSSVVLIGILVYLFLTGKALFGLDETSDAVILGLFSMAAIGIASVWQAIIYLLAILSAIALPVYALVLFRRFLTKRKEETKKSSRSKPYFVREESSSVFVWVEGSIEDVDRQNKG